MSKQYTPKATGSLQQQLRALRLAGYESVHHVHKDRDTAITGVDGVDHINLWEYGKTELGKVLAHSVQIPFTHDRFGTFPSVDCFWHWVRSEEKDDHLRMLKGNALKNASKKLTSVQVLNFRAIIMDANWQKANQHAAITRAILESKLPFECYYIQKGKDDKVRPNFSHWLVKGYEEIRNAMKQNRHPSFLFLMENRAAGIYDHVQASVNSALELKNQLLTPVVVPDAVVDNAAVVAVEDAVVDNAIDVTFSDGPASELVPQAPLGEV